MPGDIIGFDGIRGSGSGGQRPLNAVIFTISYQNEDSYKWKTIGYYRDSMGLKKYYSFLHGLWHTDSRKIKDSVWTTYQFDKMMNKYYKTKTDSFYKTKLIQTTVFDTSKRIIYSTTPITDSTFTYVSYFKNGKIYQQGVGYKNTYQSFYRKYKNKEETEANKNLIWHWCLRDTPYDIFPTGKWQMYDSVGNTTAIIHYEALPETKIISDNENVFYYNDDFYIVPNGECLIYNKRKKAKRFMFKDGEMVK